MIRFCLALAAVLGFSVGEGAQAQDALVLEGKCQELVVADHDLSKACEDSLMVAKTPRGGLITSVMQPGGAHNFYLTGKPSGRVALVEVELSLYPMEERWESTGVKGSCTIEDLNDLPAQIVCTAKDPSGFGYKLRFRAVTKRPLKLPTQ